MSRTTWIAILGTIDILAATTPAFAQPAEDDKLSAFFKSYLEAHFQQQPLKATSLGDHRFDSQLDDISPEARAGWPAAGKPEVQTSTAPPHPQPARAL